MGKLRGIVRIALAVAGHDSPHFRSNRLTVDRYRDRLEVLVDGMVGIAVEHTTMVPQIDLPKGNASWTSFSKPKTRRDEPATIATDPGGNKETQTDTPAKQGLVRCHINGPLTASGPTPRAPTSRDVVRRNKACNLKMLTVV